MRVPGIQVEKRTVEFAGAPAERYGLGEAPGHTLNAGEQALLEVLVSTTGAGHVPALSRLAHELAVNAPSRFVVPTSLVDGLLAWSGIVDPPPHVSMVELSTDCAATPNNQACADANRQLSAEVGSRVSGSGWGVGVGVVRLPEGMTRLLVAASEPTVTLEPIPSALPDGGRTPVVGELLGARQNPRLDVIGPGGQWSNPPLVRVGARGFKSELRCDQGRGAYQVELFAEGAHGPEVVANFPVHCGTSPARAAEVIIEIVQDGVDVRDVERANFDLLNRTRVARGLEPVEWDERAAEVARRHSVDMLTHNFVGHHSPTTGDVGARFDTAKIPSAIVRENIARGYGPRGIHDSLMNSPGHRVNILAEDVSYVGVGAVIGPPESNAAGAPRPIFLTQNFFEKPGADVPDDPVSALEDAVDEVRAARGLAKIPWSRDYAALAQILADGHARDAIGRARKEFDAKLAVTNYKRAGQQEVVASTFQQIRELELWLEEMPYDAVGIGLAKITRGARADKLILVLLYIEEKR